MRGKEPHDHLHIKYERLEVLLDVDRGHGRQS